MILGSVQEQKQDWNKTTILAQGLREQPDLHSLQEG